MKKLHSILQWAPKDTDPLIVSFFPDFFMIIKINDRLKNVQFRVGQCLRQHKVMFLILVRPTCFCVCITIVESVRYDLKQQLLIMLYIVSVAGTTAQSASTPSNTHACTPAYCKYMHAKL